MEGERKMEGDLTSETEPWKLEKLAYTQIHWLDKTSYTGVYFFHNQFNNSSDYHNNPRSCKRQTISSPSYKMETSPKSSDGPLNLYAKLQTDRGRLQTHSPYLQVKEPF